jgi:hypothetical protein
MPSPSAEGGAAELWAMRLEISEPVVVWVALASAGFLATGVGFAVVRMLWGKDGS